MPFIIAKTVTYVSSLTVTYVTTLYILASRHVGRLGVPMNGILLDMVRSEATLALPMGELAAPKGAD